MPPYSSKGRTPGLSSWVSGVPLGRERINDQPNANVGARAMSAIGPIADKRPILAGDGLSANDGGFDRSVQHPAQGLPQA